MKHIHTCIMGGKKEAARRQLNGTVRAHRPSFYWLAGGAREFDRRRRRPAENDLHLF